VGEDQYAAVRRTTVAEAAQVLGISAEAVRGRIRRGTLPVEREGGTVYVLLSEADHARTTTDQPRTTDQPTDRTEILIAELQDRVRSLEEANRENRRIIAALTSRIPELPPASEGSSSSEATGASTEATPQPGRVGPQTTLEGAQEGSQQMRMPEAGGAPLPRDQREEAASRPWWRRVFGG
jgi:hypothetical protein